MRLHHIGSNQTEVTTANGTQVLYSYNTPVAAWIPTQHPLSGDLHGYVKTSTFHSHTTLKHIRAFLSGVEAVPVPQSFLDGLV